MVVGTQVLLYGPCYSSNGAYVITLDRQDPVIYNASINAYSAPPVKSVAGACLRYISPPLSPDRLHYISMANSDTGRETNLDWVLVVGNDGGESLSDAKKEKGANVGAIAGAVAGSIALLLALAVLWCMLRRRRIKRVAVQPSSESNSDEGKVKTVDLLSTNSDIPRLLDGDRQPSILTNPSHTSQNTRTYQRIEPFELPPLVDHPEGKNDSAPSSTSSVTQSPTEPAPGTRVSVASLPTAPTTISAPASEPLVQPAAHPDQVQPPTPSAQGESQSSLRTHSHQSQPSQASSEATPDLSQISSDVNRILTQLGQIRRNGRRGYSGGVLSEELDDVPEGAPPEYGKHRRVQL